MSLASFIGICSEIFVRLLSVVNTTTAAAAVAAAVAVAVQIDRDKLIKRWQKLII